VWFGWLVVSGGFWWFLVAPGGFSASLPTRKPKCKCKATPRASFATPTTQNICINHVCIALCSSIQWQMGGGEGALWGLKPLSTHSKKGGFELGFPCEELKLMHKYFFCINKSVENAICLVCGQRGAWQLGYSAA